MIANRSAVTLRRHGAWSLPRRWSRGCDRAGRHARHHACLARQVLCPGVHGVHVASMGRGGGRASPGLRLRGWRSRQGLRVDAARTLLRVRSRVAAPGAPPCRRRAPVPVAGGGHGQARVIRPGDPAVTAAGYERHRSLAALLALGRAVTHRMPRRPHHPGQHRGHSCQGLSPGTNGPNVARMDRAPIRRPGRIRGARRSRPHGCEHA